MDCISGSLVRVYGQDPRTPVCGRPACAAYAAVLLHGWTAIRRDSARLPRRGSPSKPGYTNRNTEVNQPQFDCFYLCSAPHQSKTPPNTAREITRTLDAGVAWSTRAHTYGRDACSIHPSLATCSPWTTNPLMHNPPSLGDLFTPSNACVLSTSPVASCVENSPSCTVGDVRPYRHSVRWIIS